MAKSMFFQTVSLPILIFVWCIFTLFEKMLFRLLFLFGIMIQTTVVMDAYRLSADLGLQCHLSTYTNPPTHTYSVGCNESCRLFISCHLPATCLHVKMSVSGGLRSISLYMWLSPCYSGVIIYVQYGKGSQKSV
jgi:hypothetical protein